jgi:hypothetical protein
MQKRWRRRFGVQHLTWTWHKHDLNTT